MTIQKVIGDLPIIDVDTHLNEPLGTWDGIDPAFRDKGLQIREEEGRKWLLLGERKILPIRPTFVGEVDQARELVKKDSTGYEKYQLWLSAQRAGSQEKQMLLESSPEIRLDVLRAMGVNSALLLPSYGLFWPSVVDDPDLV